MIEAKCLGLDEAHKIGEAMLKYGSVTKPGRPMSYAVVDSAGVLIWFSRMDGASPLTEHMARSKAYTAIRWKRDTKEIAPLIMANEPPMQDIAVFGDLDKSAPIPGGIPIKSRDGYIAGAVGASGRTLDEDEQAALAGVQAYNALEV